MVFKNKKATVLSDSVSKNYILRREKPMSNLVPSSKINVALEMGIFRL